MVSSSKTSEKEANSLDSSTVIVEKPKKWGRSKKIDLRYVRFGLEDGTVIEGLVRPKIQVSAETSKDWAFNSCYLIRDLQKVGRLFSIREVSDSDEFTAKLPRFERFEEVADDPKIPGAPVVSIENLRKWYPLKRGLFETVFSKEEANVKAVDGVSFSLSKGEIFALAGESGSGKTTLGKVLLRLVSSSGGSIYFLGRDITRLSDREMKPLRREMQIVFQDPFESLDPRMMHG